MTPTCFFSHPTLFPKTLHQTKRRREKKGPEVKSTKRTRDNYAISISALTDGPRRVKKEKSGGEKKKGSACVDYMTMSRYCPVADEIIATGPRS